MTELKSVYEDKPYIKLSKMSKGYQWEIKIILDSSLKFLKEEMEILAKLDKQLNEQYGSDII